MQPLPPEQWDPSLQGIIDQMQGQPINIHALLANHPALLNAWWGYRMHSVTGGALLQRDTEIVVLRVAVLMKSWYEWAAHVDRGLAAGLEMNEINRVAAGPTAKAWNERDATLLAAVDSLIRKHRLATSLRTRLEVHFSDQQILDIVSLQGAYATIACMIGTWELDIEDALAERLPENVNRQSFADLLSAPDSY